MQRNLTAMNKWCQTNGIYMDVNKTKYMIFGSKQVLEKVKDFRLTVNGEQLERVSAYCYLVLTLDPSLNFDKHITKMIAKVTDKVKQLRNMRKFLNTKAAMTVYKNMILPMIEYSDIFLVAASKDNRDKMQILQNKALRVIHKVDKYYHTDLIHKESNLLKLKHRREMHLLQFMFTKKDDPHLRKARRKSGVVTRASVKLNLIVRKSRTEKYKKCVSYRGTKTWNKLPVTTQTSENKFVFKSKIHKLVSAKVGVHGPEKIEIDVGAPRPK